MAKKRTAPKKSSGKADELLEQLKHEIAAKKLGWEAGETALSVLPAEHQSKHLGLAFENRDLALMGAKWDANEAFYAEAVGALPVPTTFDWRTKDGVDWVKPVKNQGVCQSCVAFAVIGAIEANLRIVNRNANLDDNFSEGELFACGGGQCNVGWLPATALEICKTRGVVAESVVPYRGMDMPCPNVTAPRQRIDNWRRIDTTDGVKRQIVEVGPVVWGMRVFRDFMYYQGGVYRHVTGEWAGNHAILVVGYNDQQQCWICKNSWGAGWGKNENPPGYFRIGYSDPSLRGTLDGGSFAFDAYSVIVHATTPITTTTPTTTTDPNTYQKYVPELQETIQAARQNAALNAYLKYWVCGLGSQPPRVEAFHVVAGRVRAVMQICPPSFRQWFCENL